MPVIPYCAASPGTVGGCAPVRCRSCGCGPSKWGVCGASPPGPRLLGGPHAKKDVPTTSGSVVWALFASRSVHQRNCVYTAPLVWVESTGVCFQSLARRSRYSIRPLKFECDCFDPHSKRVFGHDRNRSSFGPNSTRPAQIWPYACVPDPSRSEPSREGRASVCIRAVERFLDLY